jgi:KaiC/GvpD/RAD55 family RecA-like ATPase
MNVASAQPPLTYWLGHAPKRARRVEIVPGLIAVGEVVALTGPPGCGKSALACYLATAVASATPFFGRDISGGDVVFIAAEKANESERRLLALASEELPILIVREKLVLEDEGSVGGLIARIREAQCNPRLIVLDTLARTMGRLDENSARDAGKAMSELQRIMEAFPDAALVFLHHVSRDGGNMRGSTAILGAVDLELTVKGKGAIRTLKVEKANAIPEGLTFAFKLDTIAVDDGTVIYAMPAETAPPAKERSPASTPTTRLRGDPLTAFEALQAIVGDAGDDRPILIDAWRTRTSRMFGEREPSAKRIAFNRAKERLASDGLIAVDGETVCLLQGTAQ